MTWGVEREERRDKREGSEHNEAVWYVISGNLFDDFHFTAIESLGFQEVHVGG